MAKNRAGKKDGKKEKSSSSLQFKNRKAFHDYHVIEKVECGVALIGSEVKSIREGRVILTDSYATIVDAEVFLIGLHIGEYKNAVHFGHEPTRKRKLLLHRAEIRKLIRKVDQKGHTLVPLRIYFNARGIAKVELGVCVGKRQHDKRQSMKARDADREVRREMSRY